MRNKHYQDFNLPRKLMEILRDSNKDIAGVYFHLFKILDPQKFNDELEATNIIRNGEDLYFGESGKKNWFAILHKSMRQCDFYNDCYTKRPIEILSEDERKRHNQLRRIIYGTKDYNKRDGDGNFTDEYREYLDLNTIANNEDRDEDIGGNLDMILYNTIRADHENFLYNTLVELFEMEKIELLKR